MKTLATLFLLAASLLLRAADAPADSCNHSVVLYVTCRYLGGDSSFGQRTLGHDARRRHSP